MRHNRCESDITVLKGCKQPDRNIASSNSCVALVMIFQELLTKKRLQSASLQPRPNPGKAPKTRGHMYDTASHHVIPIPSLTLAKSVSPPHMSKKIQVNLVLKMAAIPWGLPEHEIDSTSCQPGNSNEETSTFSFFLTVVAHFSSPFVAVIKHMARLSLSLLSKFYDLNKISAVRQVCRMTGEAEVMQRFR